MILLQMGNPSPTLKLLLIAFFVGLILWRLSLVFKLHLPWKKTKSYSSGTGIKKDYRRQVINFLGLDFYNRYYAKPNTYPFFLGLKHIVTGERGAGCFSLVVVLIVIIAIVRLISGGNVFGKSGSSLTILAIILFVFYLGLKLAIYASLYLFTKDFPYLVEGIVFNGREAKANAFKRAITCKPSEFAYTRLANIQRFILEEDEARSGKLPGEYDYSKVIDLYEKACQLDLTAIQPLEDKISLESEMQDYEAAVEAFDKIREMEKDLKLKYYYATDRKLAIIFEEWGGAFSIAGDHNQAIEKLSQGLEIAAKYDGGTIYYPVWSLFRERAKCHFLLGNFEESIKDNRDFVENYLLRLDERFNKNNNGGETFERSISERRFELEHYLQGVLAPFKALEDIQGAIRFLNDFRNKRERCGYPVFSKLLIRLLLDNGEKSKAKQVYDDYINSGFTWIDGFQKIQKYDWNKPDLKSEALNFNNDSVLEGMKMRMKQWRFTEALEYYHEWEQTSQSDYSHELIIGKIKKAQRVLPEASDCYEGYQNWMKEKGHMIKEEDVISYAQIKEDQGEYQAALDILSKNFVGTWHDYYKDLRKKKAIKNRILNFY